MINSEYICSKTARSHYYAARVLFFSCSDSHDAAVNRQLFTGPGGFKVSVKERIKVAQCVCVCVGETTVKG